MKGGVNVVHYPVLVAEMAKRNIRKKQIARAANICEKALYNKLTGKVPFTWPEVTSIRMAYFGDMTSDDLFAMRE